MSWWPRSIIGRARSGDPFAYRRLRVLERLADDIDERRSSVRQGDLERAREIGRLRDAPRLHAVRFRNARVIGGREIDREIALAVSGLLPGLDPAVYRVRHHDARYRDLQAHEGLQLARAHAEAAVAHDRNGLDVGTSEVRSDRGRHRVAERAVRAVGENP